MLEGGCSDAASELELAAASVLVCCVPDAESLRPCTGFDTSDAATSLLAAAAFGASESDACELSALSLRAGKLGRRFSWGVSLGVAPALESEVS